MKMGKPTDIPGLFKTPNGFAILAKASCGSVTTYKRKKLEGASKAEAALALERLKKEAAEEAVAKAKGEDPSRTLSVFARRYAEELSERREQEKISPSTQKTHVSNLERFILPIMGRMNVYEVKPKDMKDWFRTVEKMRMPAIRRGRGKKQYKQEARLYAKATLANAWRTLRAFMAWVTVEADLPRNPAAFVRWDIVGEDAALKPVLTQAEVGALMDAARKDRDPAIRMLLLLALVGAMRASEVSALRREDCDLEAGTVHVRRSHVDGHFGKTKTHKSRRVVVLPLDVRDELKAFLEWQDGQGKKVKGLPLLFPTSIGTARTTSSINTPLKRCYQAAGITKHITSHASRRTGNNLVRQEAGDLVARAVTGHVTQQMTEHYSAVDADERRKALGGAFGQSLGCTGATSTDPEKESHRAAVASGRGVLVVREGVEPSTCGL